MLVLRTVPLPFYAWERRYSHLLPVCLSQRCYVLPLRSQTCLSGVLFGLGVGVIGYAVKSGPSALRERHLNRSVPLAMGLLPRSPL